MNNAGLSSVRHSPDAELGIRDSFENEELPRTAARRTAAQAQAQARTHAHARGADHAPRAFRHDVQARSFATSRPRAEGAPRARFDGAGRTRVDANGVRTIKIRGQATPPRRRPLIDASRPIARYDQHPDRAAQWALFLGVFMVVVAIVTGS
ncbi:MAG: hypothetical protein HZB14_05380 [Actinobacteria bacterium]|nr:hypothetical protein [Actinomycetota bacterium]